MIPEEDRPPAWLADFGAIEADVAAMEAFAASLDREVRDSYEPHLQLVTTSMMTQLPGAPDAFPELKSFLADHHKAQTATFSNTFNFRDGTGHFADAAKDISERYRGADAFAHAKVKDVNRAFTEARDGSEQL
jgi:hypothetical protein